VKFNWVDWEIIMYINNWQTGTVGDPCAKLTHKCGSDLGKKKKMKLYLTATSVKWHKLHSRKKAF
jgi:hypothetical protein